MGDVLTLTSICKYLPNQCVVQLPEDKSRFSIFFDHLAKVETSEPSEISYLEEVGDDHYSTRKLRGLFGDVADKLDNRPLILHSSVESEKWAYEYLKDKPNPVIFTPTCGKHFPDLRNIPLELCESILNNLRNSGFSPIVVQSSFNRLLLNEDELIDLDLSKYICLLRQVGFYVGAKTGDENIAIAVGCRTIVYEPEDNPLYQSEEWDYKHQNHTYIRWKI